MSRFTQALHEVDARLAIPEPGRSRILLEISADMEGLFQEYLERGASEAKAEAEVMDHFDLSEEALLELIRVHDTPLQRSLEHISGQVRGPWSRILMGILALFVVLGLGRVLLQGQLYRDASAVTWILMPLLAWGLWIAGSSFRWLYLTSGDGGSGLRGGPRRILGIAGLMLVVTVCGLWLELYLGALRIRGAPGEALVHLVAWFHLSSATMVISLSGALILGFLWFFLESRARLRELNAAAELMGGAR
jgi:hypothetical protein